MEGEREAVKGVGVGIRFVTLFIDGPDISNCFLYAGICNGYH